MKKITPFLWFNNTAQEAIDFYLTLFKNAKVTSITRYGDEIPGMKGKVLTAFFELDGQEFMAIDGGPQFPFTESISLFVNCESQEEVDRLWDAFTKDGNPGQCGWLKDKFGLSWQIIPKQLGEMLSDKDPDKAHRVMMAMLQMKKIDIEKLRQA